jgi:hypothetical protein
MSNALQSSVSLNIDRNEALILMQLVTRAAAPGPGARALADFYDKIMAAGASLGVSLPPDAAGPG